ncbi:MAG: molybdopterin-guanine dinucleotide biosynthesis protein MobB [Nitrospirae bacterium]|nr:molybdopterin-guanine dinucleotide biosynthesis protein MobB [Nitrospirota bacterium]MBF0590840.1 molybdopterin-guanine dinucleotide biosynthesis protein MobB [Nitrospirota bacterium]
MIVCIGGAHSGCGKTTLAEGLLAALKGRWGAIKYTRTAFYTGIVSDKETLLQEGKDTARLLMAGAVDVVWVQAPYLGLDDVLGMALCSFNDNFNDINGIIVEGNSPIEFMRSDLVVFVYGRDMARVKEHSQQAIAKASIVVTWDGSSKNGTLNGAFSGKKICTVYEKDNQEDWDECLNIIMGDITHKEINRMGCF